MITDESVTSSGFTAISFFLPTIVLLVAFYPLAVISPTAGDYFAISGILTGTAVCGIHYVGDPGIFNSCCHYRVAKCGRSRLLCRGSQFGRAQYLLPLTRNLKAAGGNGVYGAPCFTGRGL